MDERSQRILNLIPTGRENAISSPEITRQTGIREREIQHIIEALRIDGHPIAAAVRQPLGYYIPRNETEAEEYERHMAARIKSQCIAVNCVRRVFKRPPIGLQLPLELGGEIIETGAKIQVKQDIWEIHGGLKEAS